jgi:hypothetical protein
MYAAAAALSNRVLGARDDAACRLAGGWANTVAAVATIASPARGRTTLVTPTVVRVRGTLQRTYGTERAKSKRTSPSAIPGATMGSRRRRCTTRVPASSSRDVETVP